MVFAIARFNCPYNKFGAGYGVYEGSAAAASYFNLAKKFAGYLDATRCLLAVFNVACFSIV